MTTTHEAAVSGMVTREWLRAVLESYHATDTDVEVAEWQTEEWQGERKGFMSEPMRVTVSYKVAGEGHTAHLFAKMAPINQEYRDLLTRYSWDTREVCFYKEVKSVVEALERRYVGPRELDPLWTPALYYYGKCASGDESSLVIENLAPRGYTIQDFATGFTYRQAKAAMEAAARFHAVGVALDLQETPSLPKRFPFLWPHEELLETCDQLENCLKTAVGMFEAREERGTSEAIRRFLEERDPREVLRQALTPSGKLNTLIHGDYWINNILMKEDGDDIKVCMIDWQWLGYGSPAMDVSMLLFTSLTAAQRHHLSHQLRDDYWQAFTTHLAALHIPPESMKYTRADFEAEFQRADVASCLVAMSYLDVMKSIKGGEERLMEFTKDLFHGDLCI